jgi:hypothetical protein
MEIKLKVLKAYFEKTRFSVDMEEIIEKKIPDGQVNEIQEANEKWYHEFKANKPYYTELVPDLIKNPICFLN